MTLKTYRKWLYSNDSKERFIIFNETVLLIFVIIIKKIYIFVL